MNRRSPEEPEALGPVDLTGRDGAGARPQRGEPQRGEPQRGGESAMWTDDDFTASGEYAAEYGADEFGVLGIGTPSRPPLGPVIRRRAVVWIVTALVGLVLGAAFLSVKPPPYKAVTSVLVTQSPDLPPTDQILTEVALVQSRTVALSAMRSLHLPISDKAVESFSADMTVSSVTDRVIQIVVKGTSSAATVSAARATATAFLDIRNDELRSAEQNTTAALTRQIDDGKARVISLTTRIAAIPHSGLTTAQQTQLATLTSELRTQKASLTGLVQAAQSEEATAAVTTSAMIHGSQVLDPATAIPRSHLKYPVLYYGGGLIGGLAVGLSLVILQALVSRRLRRRDDVARALGGPVQLSVGRLGGFATRSVSGAVQRPAVRQIVSHLRKSLPPSQHAAALAVVPGDDLRVPAISLVSLASSYAREGRRVLIADLTPGMTVGRLLKVPGAGVTLTEADGHEVLIAIPEPGNGTPTGPIDRATSSGQLPPSPFDQHVDKAFRTADIMLTLMCLDPAMGADHLPTWAGGAIVMLTTGRCSVMKVHAIGEMIRVSGTPLTGAILLGADRGDESLGFTPGAADELKPELPASKPQPAAKRPAPDHQTQPTGPSQPGGQPQPGGQVQTGGQMQRGGQPQQGGQVQPGGQPQQGGQVQPGGQPQPGGGEASGPNQGQADHRDHGSGPRPVTNGGRVVASLATGKARSGWPDDGESGDRE
jgi:capsular polysaccharide biosynthesis protein